MAWIVDFEKCPELYPTDRHDPKFWEMLGRTAATYGFLEEVLGKAIYSLTATRPYEEREKDEAYKRLISTLECALTDPLGKLITSYEKAVRDHPSAPKNDLDELVPAMRKAAELRNVFCHASWGEPDENGASWPSFVSKDRKSKDLHFVDTPMDVQYLAQVQRHVAELATRVFQSVTRMGWQFPGSNSPGEPICKP